MKANFHAPAFLVFLLTSLAATSPAEYKTVKLQFPKVMFGQGPVPDNLPNLERQDSLNEVKEFKVPANAENLAKGKAVSSSVPAPAKGKLDLITDGDADGSEGKFVDLAEGHQWVQIDLAAQATIHKIVLWHQQNKIYQAVVVQISNDPEFKKDAVTVWNSDDANVLRLGVGKDPTYWDTNYGRVIDANDVKGRYLRFHSNGNTSNNGNQYTEIEVWGTDLGLVDEKIVQVQFPKPIMGSTPVLSILPNLEKPDPSKIVREFKVPVTAENLAKGKKVGSSDPPPVSGTLDLITDGDATDSKEKIVELAAGHQWVQIDLAAQATIHKIVLWHSHRQPKAYKAVVIQISDDSEFKEGATTVWNSDDINLVGLGEGKDPTYIETNHGRVINVSDVKGRYARFHNNGNSNDDMNTYAEIQVWASPVK